LKLLGAADFLGVAEPGLVVRAREDAEVCRTGMYISLPIHMDGSA
jgi:hypothetical protein